MSVGNHAQLWVVGPANGKRTDVFLLLRGEGDIAGDGLELRLVAQRHEVPRDVGEGLLHLRAEHLRGIAGMMLGYPVLNWSLRGRLGAPTWP